MDKDTTVNVQTFLNEHPFSGFQWLIFALCFLIVLLDGFDTAAIGFIAPSLLKEWGVSRPALGAGAERRAVRAGVGALASGPLADRLGRRRAADRLGAGVRRGLPRLGVFRPTWTQLTVLRFVTGLGLGAAMPNAVTLMSEYCPDSRRATLTNPMFCGFPLGAAFGGFLAAWMIPQFGWRSVLMLGGVAPLGARGAAAARAAGIGALHGREGRSRSRGSARRCARISQRRRARPLVRDDRAGAAQPTRRAACASCCRAATSSAR